jgi:ribonuclease HI
MPFYAVANGNSIGIFSNWDECNQSVKGFKNAIYKKFMNQADAEEFIRVHSVTLEDPVVPIENIVEITPDYYVYTDGACSNNGRSNASAGIGIFFGINDSRNLSQKIEGKQTNNTAELMAIIQTYHIIERDINAGKKIGIVSDSEYAIKCVSSYGEKCDLTGWKKEIPNKELVKTVYELYKDKSNIRFIHIRAHTDNTDVHSIGNDNADKLANQAIGLEKCPYASR